HHCADALPMYAQIHGDPSFEVRAQFATLQCNFELLQAGDHGTPAAQRTALLKDIGSGLQKFDTQAADYDKRKTANDQVPLNDMRGKVAVMKAVYASVQAEPNEQSIIDALAGFEQKYPNQKDLLPQVARLRLVAYQYLGRFAEAEAEAKAHGTLLLASL